ncbi:MAG: NADH-quinone oxidoreductase subunit J family protein [Vicinamibacterales bacterium]
MADAITFYSLAALILLFAVLVVTVRNTLYSAILLAVDFVFVAILYAAMNNLLLAVFQLMVYAAGIVLVYVFVVILVNLKRAPEEHVDPNRRSGLGGIIAAVVLVELALVGVYNAIRPAPAAGAAVSQPGSVENVGMALFTNYLIPFEVASMLLLVAMVGAIILAKKEL